MCRSRFWLPPANPGPSVGVCVFVCAFHLHAVSPNSRVRCGCACWGSLFRFAQPFLAAATGVCVFVYALRLYLAHPGWGPWSVRLDSGFGVHPHIQAGVFGCVCLCARFSCNPPILAGVCGFGVWVRVLAFGPPMPGCGVWMCVFVRPPARRQSWLGCAVRVSASVRSSAAPRQSWLGCWGLSVGVRAPPAPRHSWVGVLWCVGWMLPGSFSNALVCCVLCPLPGFGAPRGRCCLVPVRVPWLWPAVSFWRASWPCSGAPRIVRSGRSRCSGWLPCCCGAFHHPGALAPGFIGRLRGAR